MINNKKISSLKIKKEAINVAFFVFAVFISSCSSIYRLTIEIQEPAPITLPADINRILIVNNTLKQPSDKGINRICNENVVNNPKLNLDSVVDLCIQSLAFRINNAHFFDKIAIYKKLPRTDNEWMSIVPLSDEFKYEIFETQGFDAIISIDRLLFSMEEMVKNEYNLWNYSYVYVDNCVEGKLNVNLYLYDSELPFSSFTISDTVATKTLIQADSLFVLKELPEMQIKDIAYALGEKLTYRIIPCWISQERMIYAGSNARMQEALSYLKNEKWNVAESLWLNEYEKKSKNTDKAKLAANIAVANEIQDKLDLALRWANTAQEYFPEKSEGQIFITAYIAELQKRIQNDRLLDLQWGKK